MLNTPSMSGSYGFVADQLMMSLKTVKTRFKYPHLNLKSKELSKGSNFKPQSPAKGSIREIGRKGMGTVDKPCVMRGWTSLATNQSYSDGSDVSSPNERIQVVSTRIRDISTGISFNGLFRMRSTESKGISNNSEGTT